MPRIAAWGLLLALLEAGAGSAQAASAPQTPGHHDLRLQTRQLSLAYAVYLPKTYASDTKPRPMIVFLCGAGEVGNNHEPLYVHGPAAELKRDPAMAEWADLIVLSPQCPADLRWESPGMPRAVLDLIGHAKRNWRVDPTRVYLTGLSMGGAGTWHVALEGPGTFAAIAPVSAVEVHRDRMAQAVKDTTVWIISGSNDPPCAEGSRKMAAALAEKKVDVLLTEVPDADHGVWGHFYNKRQFYEFLLLHRRGLPAPTHRPTPQQLLRLAYVPPQSAETAVAEPFSKFLPGWQLLDCGKDHQPGLKVEHDGRPNVFVTSPLDAGTPCRMIGLLTVPKNKATMLKLTVGHHDRGRWRLAVLANGKELTSKPIGGQNDADGGGWSDIGVDLSSLAGRQVRLELLNFAVDDAPAAAYWGVVEIQSHDRPPVSADGSTQPALGA